jgi:hypothetical protein
MKRQIIECRVEERVECCRGKEGNVQVRNFCERGTKDNSGSEGIGLKSSPHVHI